MIIRYYLAFIFTAILAACNPAGRSPERAPSESPPALLAVERSAAPVSAQLKADLDSALAMQENWQFREALDILQLAIEREASRPQAVTDTVLALAYHKAGVSCYMLDEYERSIGYFERALHIREAVFSPDHPDVIRGYNNIGNVYELTGEREKALEYLHHSLKLQPEPPIDPYPATMRALGRIYGDLNDTYRAEKYLELSLAAYRRLHPDNPQEIARAYTDLAYFYLNKEKFEASLEASRQALLIQMSLPEKRRPDSSGIANSYTNISIAFEKMGQLDSAMNYQTQALQWNRRLYPADDAQLALNYNNIGYIHLLQRNWPEAQTALARAIRINTQNGDNLKLCDNLENQGNLSYGQGKYDEALAWYHTALRRLLPDAPADQELLTIPRVDDVKVELLRVMNNLYLKGKALRTRFAESGQPADLQLALQHFDTLGRLADRLRFSYLADDSKINLARQTKVFFEEAIKTCLDLNRQTGDVAYARRAFEITEKSKAIVLLEALKETHARQFAGLDAADLQLERRLKQQIAQLELDIYQARQQANGSADQVQEWQRRLISTYEEYERLIAQLEQKSPDYYRLKYADRVLSVEDIQSQPELLADDQALVEFFVGDEAVYIFNLSRRDFSVSAIPLDFSLTTAVDSFRQSISQFLQAPESTLPVYREQGRRLYQKLWAPLTGSLPEKVIIVPDDILGLLPFEALLTGPVEPDQPLQTWPYLIKEHQISYNYSASLRHETLQKMPEAPRYDQILAFAPSFEQKIVGPPSAPTQNPIADNTRGVEVRQGLQPLFFNKKEVESIGRIAAARIFSETQATKASFRKWAPRYRFLHIATHGLADDEEPDYSFIAFSQPADTILLDEVLLVNELYNLQLNADLVVLSACETGVGKIRRGEGIVSLARGFSYAGARSIITTLWNISDQRSSDLMRSFYEQLRVGQPKDAALRQAKMQFVNQNGKWAHPFFWAGFIPLGDMTPVEIASPVWWRKLPRWALIIVLTAIGAGGWIGGRKLRGKTSLS